MIGIAKTIKDNVQTCTSEKLNEALDSPQVAEVCRAIAQALEAHRRGEMTKEAFEATKARMKKQLPILTLHATFKNGRRKNDEAIPSGLAIYDLDHIANPRAKWAEIEARKEELGILLAHITPSTEGLRLAFIIPNGKSLADAQAWMAEQLGDTQYDACVKDYARCSFLVPREYVLYVDEEGLLAELLPSREGEGGVSESAQVDNKADEMDVCHTPPTPSQEGTYPVTYEEIPYETLVEVLEEQMGGAPEHESRNNFIFSMACHLRYVCNDDPLWIAQVLPAYGEGEDKWRATIKSACARNQAKKMPRIMERTLTICRERLGLDTEEKLEIGTPPAMPRRLPPLVKLLVSRTPKIYQPAVAHAIFPALATHLWKTTFRYIDNVEHEATLMNVLMAGTGAGKNCISEPINRIMADIRERDRVNLQREREWKREMQTKGANKDKRQRPEGLVIQEIDPDMTNAAFVQRLADAEERFLYARMNEIDQFDALKTNANKKAHFQIMCLAFDPGNVYGQTRVGTGSVSERVCIRFNWNASTTLAKGKDYFRSVLTDGPISRINFCTIPKRTIGSEMPVFGQYDASFDEELRPYIDNLNKARGLVECKAVNRLSKKLVEEYAEFSRLSQDRVYENLSFRANVIAFLKAMVLYVAHGEKWDKTMEEFIRWSLEYDMWCKMQFFGKAIGRLEKDDEETFRTKGPQNLLDLLPEVFTREEAQLMRHRQGISEGNVRTMLSNWKRRGYIEEYGDVMPQNEVARQQYIKTPSYLEKHPQAA
ncbi:MAG: VirE protein [Bacteroidaceae bacterium]|nr:VirE protein [Bacteroidaceae bacterium]